MKANLLQIQHYPESFLRIWRYHKSFTRHERIGRLEALVKQSQDVSRKLNESIPLYFDVTTVLLSHNRAYFTDL